MIKLLVSWYHLGESGTSMKDSIQKRSSQMQAMNLCICLLLGVLMHSQSNYPKYLTIIFRPSILLSWLGRFTWGLGILAWRIPRAEEPQQVTVHDIIKESGSWATFTHFNLSLLTCCCILCHHGIMLDMLTVSSSTCWWHQQLLHRDVFFLLSNQLLIHFTNILEWKDVDTF